jgi:hypothetical protein
VKFWGAILVVAFSSLLALAQEPDPLETRSVQHIQPVEPADPISSDRILGVIPNFQTVSDPNRPVARLTAKQKFSLFVKETVDPFTVVSAVMGAGMSQAGNGTPQYGYGLAAYSRRVGAAYADMATQNFFSDGLLAGVLHQDPRYYRMGPEHSIPRRVMYSMTRMIIGRKDSGRPTFNYAYIGGMSMGIALSNAYYPSSSVNGSVTAGRFVSSLTGAAFGNLLPEFWPDVRQKLAHLHRRR